MRNRTATAIATVLAILAWATLALQLWLTVRLVMVGGGDPMLGVLRYYSYFTVLTNTLAALVLTDSVRDADARSWWSSPSVRGASVACMATVGIIYTLVLRDAWDPRGLQKFADVVLHDFMPVAFVAYWLVFWRTGTLRAGHVPSWLIYPLAYLAYCLVHGAIANWYPYPFVDAGKLGYSQVFVNALGITIAFTILCLIIVAIDRAYRLTARIPASV